MFFPCRDFKMEDGKAEIPLNVTVQGDVLVVIYHARSTLGGRLQAKVESRSAYGRLESSSLDSSDSVFGIKKNIHF